MQVTTRQQREAMKRVFDRHPIDAFHRPVQCKHQRPITYREFRRKVVAGWDCLMVEWCGMWLGIETDGYTHS